MKERKQKQVTFAIPQIESEYKIYHYLDTNHINRPLHKHGFYELYYPISNNVTYCIGDAFFSLQAGDILLFSIDQYHGPVFYEHEKGYERIVLQVTAPLLQSLSSEKSNLCSAFHREFPCIYRFAPEIRNNIRLLLSKLLMEQDTHAFGHDLLYRAYLTELFVLINKYHEDEELGGKTLTNSAKKAQMIATTNHYIEENLEENICVDDLCKQAYLSKYYFMRVFKEMTGVSVYKYITQKRLMAAVRLIKQSVPIASVCLQCGFKDYPGFFRAFKKQFGMSPTQYYNECKLQLERDSKNNL